MRRRSLVRSLRTPIFLLIPSLCHGTLESDLKCVIYIVFSYQLLQCSRRALANEVSFDRRPVVVGSATNGPRIHGLVIAECV